MFVINDDNSIYITRGDVAYFYVQAYEGEQEYEFKPGDVLRFKVFDKKGCDCVAFYKDFAVEEETETVEVFLCEQETKIGGVIHKPRDYWYEVELNPETNPQTIIGYDEDGARIFRLFPEGADEVYIEPTPEEIGTVDTELDATSTRPVQNRAIAEEVLALRGYIDRVSDAAAKVSYYNATGNGVIIDDGEDAMRTYASGQDMTVVSHIGTVRINGEGYTAAGQENRTFTESTSDRVAVRVARLDAESGDIQILWRDCVEENGVLTSKSEGVVIPRRDTQYHDLILAIVRIPGGASAITDDMIQDTRRNAYLCGWVTRTGAGGDGEGGEVVTISGLTVEQIGADAEANALEYRMTLEQTDGSEVAAEFQIPQNNGSEADGVDVLARYGTGTQDEPIQIDFASGETYVFAPGTYYLAEHLVFANPVLQDVTIRAHGATLMLCGNVFLDTTCPGFRMYGGTVDGMDTARYGIKLAGSPGCVFDGVTFANFGSAETVDTQMLALYGDCTGFTVQNCTFDGCAAGVAGDDGYIHAYGLFINRTASNNEYSRSGTVENCEFDDIAGIDTADKKADGDGIFIQAPPYEGEDGNIVYPDCRVVIRGCRFYACKKRGVKAAAYGVTVEDCVFEGAFWYAGIDLQYGHGTVHGCHIVNTSDYNGSVTSALVASDGGFTIRDCYLSAPYYDSENARDTYHPGVRCTTRLPASVIPSDTVWDVIRINGCYFDGVSCGVQLYNSNTDADSYRLRGLEITDCRFGDINQTHGVNVSTTLFSEIGVFVFTDFRFNYGDNRTAVKDAMAAAHPGLDREFKYPVGIGVPVTLTFMLYSRYWTDEPMSGYDGLPDCPHALIIYEGSNMGGIVYKKYTSHGSVLVGTKNPADITSTLGKQLLYNSSIGDQYTNRTDGTVWVCVGAGSADSVGTWQQSGTGGGAEYENGMGVYY